MWKISILPCCLIFSLELSGQNFEIPKTKSDREIIKHTGLSLKFNSKHKLSDWVAYKLTKEELTGHQSRTNNFRPDPHVPLGTAVDSDYLGSGYDRGHLLPAADARWSKKAMSATFFYSNITPQNANFNRGIWLFLEMQVRHWTRLNEELFIVTGPVLKDTLQKKIGNNKISVPKRHYKVILDYRKPQIKAIGFIIPNQPTKKYIQDFACSVDQVEAETGIDFFYQLPDEEENKIESHFDLAAWPIKIEEKWWRKTKEIDEKKKSSKIQLSEKKAAPAAKEINETPAKPGKIAMNPKILFGLLLGISATLGTAVVILVKRHN